MTDMDGIKGAEEKTDFVSHIFATKSERHKVTQNNFRISICLLYLFFFAYFYGNQILPK